MTSNRGTRLATILAAYWDGAPHTNLRLPISARREARAAGDGPGCEAGARRQAARQLGRHNFDGLSLQIVTVAGDTGGLGTVRFTRCFGNSGGRASGLPPTDAPDAFGCEMAARGYNKQGRSRPQP